MFTNRAVIFGFTHIPLTSQGFLTYCSSVNFYNIEKRKNTCLIIFRDLQNHVNGILEAKCSLGNIAILACKFQYTYCKMLFNCVQCVLIYTCANSNITHNLIRFGLDDLIKCAKFHSSSVNPIKIPVYSACSYYRVAEVECFTT